MRRELLRALRQLTPDERNILKSVRSAPTDRLIDRAELIGYARPIRAEAAMRQHWVEMAVLSELFRRGAIEQVRHFYPRF